MSILDDNGSWVVLLMLSFLLWVLGPVCLMETLINHPRKRKLLDEYAQSGIDTRAVVTQQRVTIQRTIFAKPGQINEISYEYIAPDTGTLVQKDSVHVDFLPTGRVIVVFVFPGFPASGYPQAMVDARGNIYGNCRRICTIICSSSFLFLWVFMIIDVLACGFGSDQDCLAIKPATYILTTVAWALTGLPITSRFYSLWQKAILGESSEGSDEPQVPTAEVVSVLGSGEPGNVHSSDCEHLIAKPIHNVESEGARKVNVLEIIR